MKRLVPILIIIVLIASAVFLFKNCEPRKKPNAENANTSSETTTENSENTSGITGENPQALPETALTPEQQETLEAAKKVSENFQNLSEEDQKNAFINANIDFTCLIYVDQKILEDTQRLKESIDAAYRKHDLPVNNDTLMMTILSKYENDQYVIDTVRTNSAPCANGNEPIYL